MHIKLENDLRMVADTALFVSRVARNKGLSEKRAHELCFVTEAVLEIRIKELRKEDPYILLDIEDAAGELKISITDKGYPYIPDDKQTEILRQGLVDRFKHEQLGSEGQRIIFYYGYEQSDEVKLLRSKTVLLDQDITCHLTSTNDEDILEAIRCLYEVYGYGYGHQELYRINTFKDMLESGRYVSMIAANAHGQSVGYAAISEIEGLEGIMEVCNLAVIPAARKLGIAGKLVKELLDSAGSSNLSGLFSRAIMDHEASQRLFNSNGFTPCGMYFNMVPLSSTGADIAKDLPADKLPRSHTAYAVHINDRKTEHRIYVAEECRDFVTSIFDKEHINYTVMQDADVEKPDLSQVTFDFGSVTKTLDIIISSVGRDLMDRIDKETNRLNSMVEAVMIYLNMQDPACTEIYNNLRKRGYIFSGCLPGSTKGDFLLIQDLKGRTASRENTKAAPGYDKMIDELYAISPSI